MRALERFVAQRTDPALLAMERCELCAVPVGEGHAHVANLETRTLLCSCRACYLLFTNPGAGRGKFRAVPARYRRLHGFALTPARWEALEIPVAMAFLFANSTLGRVVAFYPSPAGATECLLALDAWRALLDANPVLADLEPDVEALLVRGCRGAPFECFVVPIDACYTLTATVRRHWKGFDGGDEAAAAIDRFFADLRQRCDEPGAGAAS